MSQVSTYLAGYFECCRDFTLVMQDFNIQCHATENELVASYTSSSRFFLRRSKPHLSSLADPISSCCHGNGTYVSLIKTKLKFVLLTCLLPFLATKGSRVLEEKVNETEVSKTVLSHLKCVRACVRERALVFFFWAPNCQ